MKLEQIPNAICILRIILIIPIVASLFSQRFETALLLMLIAGFSDGLDGFLAKTFDWRTRLGGLLDPAADKLLLVSSFVSLAMLGLVPVSLTVIVILRDVVIVAGALSYQRVVGELHGEPSLISKLNTACQLAFVVLTIMQAAWQQPGAQWLAPLGAMVVFTSVTSGLNYVLVWSARVRQRLRTS